MWQEPLASQSKWYSAHFLSWVSYKNSYRSSASLIEMEIFPRSEGHGPNIFWGLPPRTPTLWSYSHITLPRLNYFSVWTHPWSSILPYYAKGKFSNQNLAPPHFSGLVGGPAKSTVFRKLHRLQIPKRIHPNDLLIKHISFPSRVWNQIIIKIKYIICSLKAVFPPLFWTLLLLNQFIYTSAKLISLFMCHVLSTRGRSRLSTASFPFFFSVVLVLSSPALSFRYFFCYPRAQTNQILYAWSSSAFLPFNASRER